MGKHSIHPGAPPVVLLIALKTTELIIDQYLKIRPLTKHDGRGRSLYGPAADHIKVSRVCEAAQWRSSLLQLRWLRPICAPAEPGCRWTVNQIVHPKMNCHHLLTFWNTKDILKIFFLWCSAEEIKSSCFGITWQWVNNFLDERVNKWF